MTKGYKIIEDKHTITYPSEKEGLVVFKTKEAIEDAIRRQNEFDKFCEEHFK